jgi:transposase
MKIKRNKTRLFLSKFYVKMRRKFIKLKIIKIIGVNEEFD